MTLYLCDACGAKAVTHKLSQPLAECWPDPNKIPCRPNGTCAACQKITSTMAYPDLNARHAALIRQLPEAQNQ